MGSLLNFILEKGSDKMNCEECKHIGDRIIDLCRAEDLTLDEAKVVLESILISIKATIDARELT